MLERLRGSGADAAADEKEGVMSEENTFPHVNWGQLNSEDLRRGMGRL